MLQTLPVVVLLKWRPPEKYFLLKEKLMICIFDMFYIMLSRETLLYRKGKSFILKHSFHIWYILQYVVRNTLLYKRKSFIFNTFQQK